MIKSMTAFARAKKATESLEVNIEIRSVNSRYLDIFLRLPNIYQVLEEKIKGIITGRVTRGRIELILQVKSGVDEAKIFEIDESKAKSYYNALTQLKNQFNLNSEITLESMAGSGSIIKSTDTERNLDEEWGIIKDCLNCAFDDLELMKKKEGDYIAKNFIERLKFIENCIDQIESEAQDISALYQEKLKDRIYSLTKGVIEIDSARIAQEAAFIADKSDISEEILRAKSHINQFRAFIDSVDPSGRKINFLLQEFNREFNTMGSKAGSAKISHTIVDLKSELEKLREQVQNIE